MAKTFAFSARAYDTVVRYGGEEFAVILPQTSRKDAALAAERIRVAVEQQTIIYEGRNLGNISVSIGIATCPIDSLGMVGLVQRADQALYVAKRKRNCVVAFCDYNRSSHTRDSRPAFEREANASIGRSSSRQSQSREA